MPTVLLRLALTLLLALGVTASSGAEPDRVVVFGLQMRTDPTDNSSLGAYARELVETVGRATGIRYRIVEYNIYPDLLAAFDRGEVDVMPLITRLPDREATMSFTVPHFQASYMVFGRAGDPVPKKFEDIGSARIVVQEGSATHQYLRRQPWATHVLARGDVHLALDDLIHNRADYWINNSFFGSFRLREAGLSGRIVPMIAAPGESNDVCMAVHVADTALLARLNEGLFIAGQNGDLRRIYEKWNPLFESHWLPRATIQRWAAALASFALLAWLWYLWRLRRARIRAETVERTVRERTRELAEANEHLRASETQLRVIWENALDAMRLTDASGTVRRVNAAYCRLMDLPRERLERHSLAEPYPPERRPEILARFNERFSTRAVQTLHATTVTLATGRILHVEVVNSFLEIPGEPPLLLSVFRDISARKRAEDERAELQTRLFQSQKQEALGVLAGGVAHDFNNILAIILNYTALAQADCPPSLTHVQKYLDEVLASGRRAAELVRQILLFTRSEETERFPLRLQNTINEALTLLRSSLPASISLHADLDPATPPILGNPSQLHQVMMNLGINAAHAMTGRDQGILTISLHPCSIDADLARRFPDLRPGPHLRLEVGDNGCGIDELVLPRIFEPFFTTKPVGQGTGLGLAVVQSIIRAHAGAITVRSQPGVGTTFEILFPTHASPVSDTSPPPTTAASPLPCGSGQHILLVDDEDSISRSLQLALERIGYRVTALNHPAAALARFEAAPSTFDLILTDYRMPEMDGVSLARRVLAHRSDLPIIIASGFADGITPASLRSLGISDLIEKPIELRQLAELLSSRLSSSSS